MKTELVALRRRTSRMVKTIILAFAVLTMATGCGTLETGVAAGNRSAIR